MYNDFADLIGLSPEQADINEVGKTIAMQYLRIPFTYSPDDSECPNTPTSSTVAGGTQSRRSLTRWTRTAGPIDLVTRRYPDRLIIKVTNMCGMYCRFCQRRRLIGETDKNVPWSRIKAAIEYVRENREIRDVLITGGDAFMLSDSMIEKLLRELREIDHVEIIRFGTRTPVTLPQRITENLVNTLKKYHPVYVNTHFNSPREITKESKEACKRWLCGYSCR